MTASDPNAGAPHPDGTIVSSPERALAAVRALRYRRRRIRAIDGFLRLFVVAVLLVWVTFFLDWSLDLPVGVRVLSIAAAVTFGVLALRVFVLGTRRRVSDAWIAAQIEACEGLDQSLVTAIQLASEDNPRRQFYSPVLLERTVREAEERVASIQASGLVSSRGVLITCTILVGLIVPMVVGATLRPSLARTYVQRDLLFRDEPWPRSYDLRIEEPGERETLIAMGDTLSVKVLKLRGGDARASLEVEFEDGSEEEFTLEKKGDNSFRKVFANVTRGFSFRVTCGDYRSGLYTVDVRNRPRVEEISLEFDYPDYTGLDQLVGDGASSERNLGGHVKVPAGTEVRYRAQTSIPVSKAVWVEEYQAGGEAKVDRVDLAIDGGRALSGSFTAVRNGTYHFELTSGDGFQNPSPIRYRIAVVPDQSPIVQIVAPGRNTEVSLRAQFPVELEATDDYGLVSGRLVFRLDDGTNRGTDGELPELTSVGIEELSTGDTKANPIIDLDLEPFGLAEGQRVEYYAEALDAIGQLGPSRKYVLTIVAEDELMRILQDELSLVRESLEQCLEWQKEAREEVEDVVDATLAGAKVRERDLPELRHARLTQERVGERIEESAVRVIEIIDRARENRLVWTELPRVESIRDRLTGIADDLVPPALSGLNEVVRLAEKASQKEILASLDHQRVLERSLRDLLVDLREWGDLRSLIRKVEELVGTQRELEDKVREKVKESLGDGDDGGR